MAIDLKNETMEFYLWLIVIKLAILTAIHILHGIIGISTSYKKNLKKKYTATNIEAPPLRPTTNANPHTTT